MSKKKTNEKRYQVIKPFLEGEKKLKEIENESGISYATLKRWVKSYKETGISGLKKKVRKDKSQHRSISHRTMDFIKKTYESNPNIKISSLYKKCCAFLKEINEESISYNTVYRIVNNLDKYIQSHAELHIERVKRKNQAYRMTHTPLDIEVLDPTTGSYSKPLLYICYDTATLDILNYKLSFQEFRLKESLFILRDTILKVQDHTDTDILIESFIIDSFKVKDFKRIQEVKAQTGIAIYNSENKIDEIERFNNFLREDILKILLHSGQSVDLESLDKLVFSYIYMSAKEYRGSCRISPTRSHLEESLDILLEESQRYIQEYGIRFKNILYKNSALKSQVGSKATVKYDPLNPGSIVVYIEDRYLCTAYSS